MTLPLSSHGCAFDGSAYALVGTAAAQIASQGFLDLNVRRLRVGFQQRAGRPDHAVDAITALNCLLIDKGLLQFARLAVLAQAFQRGDGFFCQGADGQQTRAGRHALRMNSTGTALAEATAILCTIKCQVVAQNVEQRGVRISGYSLRFSIHVESVAWYVLYLFFIKNLQL